MLRMRMRTASLSTCSWPCAVLSCREVFPGVDLFLCWYHVRAAVNKNIAEKASVKSSANILMLIALFAAVMYCPHDTEELVPAFMLRKFFEGSAAAGAQSR